MHDIICGNRIISSNIVNSDLYIDIYENVSLWEFSFTKFPKLKTEKIIKARYKYSKNTEILDLLSTLRNDFEISFFKTLALKAVAASLTINAQQTDTFKMKTLILSAGHNSEKKGASWKTLNEYDTNTTWIEEISNYLILKGVKVRVIKTGTLPKKVEEVNKIHAEIKNCIAVELHFNAAGTKYIEGNETLYCPKSETGKAIATIFNTAFFNSAKDFVKKDRGVKEGWYKMDRPGIVDFYEDKDGDEMPDYWLKSTNCPALILEPCFLCQVETIGDNWKIVAHKIADALEEIIK